MWVAERVGEVMLAKAALLYLVASKQTQERLFVLTACTCVLLPSLQLPWRRCQVGLPAVAAPKPPPCTHQHAPARTAQR